MTRTVHNYYLYLKQLQETTANKKLMRCVCANALNETGSKEKRARLNFVRALMPIKTNHERASERTTAHSI